MQTIRQWARDIIIYLLVPSWFVFRNVQVYLVRKHIRQLWIKLHCSELCWLFLCRYWSLTQFYWGVFTFSFSALVSIVSFLISETFWFLPCRMSEPAWTIWTVCWKWNQRTRPPWSSCRKCRRRNEDRSGTRGSSKDVSLLWVQEAKVIFFYKNQLVENSRAVTWFYCLWVQDQARVSQNSFTEFLFDVFTLTWTDMKLVSRCL